MKHLKKGRTLGRVRSQRRALLAGLASSLFLHKRIMTTLAKAKEVRPYAEKLITHARRKSLSQIRQVKKVIPRIAAKELFDVIAPGVVERRGGYLRIIKAGPRKSDAAPMAVVELVDFRKKKDEKKAKPAKGEEVKVKKAKE